MLKRSPLYEQHDQAGAKFVDFSGWEMPLHYGSQLEEHHQVRRDAGVFDVSHMTIVDLLGTGGRAFLRYLLANDIDRLQHTGKALYSCLLNEQGRVLDDLVVYYRRPDSYRLIFNCATREKDLAWVAQQAEGFAVGIQERAELVMLAIQGPNAIEKVQRILHPTLMDLVATLQPFESVEYEDWFVSRTGYTGEDGLEVILPGDKAPEFWQALLDNDVKPCGLGARDTLRLEAGFSLYGAEMDEETTPLEANLGWTIVWEPTDRDFVGRTALELQKERGIERKLVGIVLEEKGVLRDHQKVIIPDVGEGEITSGTFSPTLKRAIALARVPRGATLDATCYVEIRGKQIPARITKPRFVRHGQSLIN